MNTERDFIISELERSRHRSARWHGGAPGKRLSPASTITLTDGDVAAANLT